jgi:hypothetical protein
MESCFNGLGPDFLKPKENSHLGYLGIDGWIILTGFKEKRYKAAD